MSHAADAEQRLTDLEIKVGFMEDLVDSLNEVVARQQQHIELLLREVSALRMQQDDGGAVRGSAVCATSCRHTTEVREVGEVRGRGWPCAAVSGLSTWTWGA